MSEQSSSGTERLSPQCFNQNCEKTYESVNEMVAVPGGRGRSPRHFCESCAKRIRRGPPMADGGPIALAYDDTDGELIAELYTPEVVAECADSWWIRIEILEKSAFPEDCSVNTETEQ